MVNRDYIRNLKFNRMLYLLKLLQKDKIQLISKKLDCVKDQDFSNASYYRDQELIIDKKIEQLNKNDSK